MNSSSCTPSSQEQWEEYAAKMRRYQQELHEYNSLLQRRAYLEDASSDSETDSELEPEAKAPQPRPQAPAPAVAPEPTAPKTKGQRAWEEFCATMGEATRWVFVFILVSQGRGWERFSAIGGMGGFALAVYLVFLWSYLYRRCPRFSLSYGEEGVCKVGSGGGSKVGDLGEPTLPAKLLRLSGLLIRSLNPWWRAEGLEGA